MAIPTVSIVEIVKPRIWVEIDFFGARHVVIKYDDRELFTYATIHYGYGYNDNSSCEAAAIAIAVSIGATEPVEVRQRPLPPDLFRESQEADARRFAWYFSDKPKGDWLQTYLDGIRAGWTTDQWRAAIDAAMATEKAA